MQVANHAVAKTPKLKPLFRTSAAGAALLLSAASSVAAPVSINFDDLGPEVVLGSNYSALGVTFLNAMTVEYRNGIPVFCAFAGSTCPTTIKSTESFANGFQPQPDTPITAVFAFPLQEASLTAISINAHGYLFRAYDSEVGGNLVDSEEIVGPDNPLDNSFHATLTVSGGNIRRIEFSQLRYIANIDDTIFDNLSFLAQSNIPEPFTGLLAVSALALLLVNRRHLTQSARHSASQTQPDRDHRSPRRVFTSESAA